MNGSHVDVKTIALLIALVLSFFVIVGTFRLVKSILKEAEKVAVAALVWRMVSGAHLHGKRHTDAGWFTYGTKSKRHEFDQTGFMNKWEHTPRAHRALWRWGCLFAFAGLIYGLIADWTVTLNALKALGVFVLCVVAFTLEKKARLRVHNRHVTNPIAKSLSPILRLSDHAVRRLIHIDPENVANEDGEIGWFEVPPAITPGQDLQETIGRIFDAHLPVDSEMVFTLDRSPRIGVVKAAQKPPPMVLWDETVAAMEAAAYGDIIIGKDRFKNIFKANFIEMDDPHWAFCVQSKRGKSNFLGLTAVQVLHQDPQARVLAVDPKRSSLIDFLGSPDYNPEIHNGLKPLIPGVTMANDPTRPEQMWDVITLARKLFDSRSAEYARDRNKKFPICLVIVDELNMLRGIIGDMWDAMVAENNRRPKEDRDDLGKECPMWADIRTLLQAGRFVGIHVMAVAQDFRDDAIGGKGGRNLFGLRGMGGFHPNQWKYFVGTTPVPVAQKGVGRWIFTQGEDQDWVQITLCDADKAYAWAAKGRELFVGDDDDDASVHHVDTTLSSAGILTGKTDGHEVPDLRIIGLQAAADFLGKQLTTFEKARTRAKRSGGIPGEFKVGRQPAWYPADLDRWNKSLPGYKGGSVSDD